MAARLTDQQKKKIVADYVMMQSVNAAAKKNGVSWSTAKAVLDELGDIEKKLEQKKEENTADILAYMERQRGVVCEIIGKGLEALNSPEKLAAATPAQFNVERAIDGLEPTERCLMRLRYLDGLRWEEICVRMAYSWRQAHRAHAQALIKLENQKKVGA